jgi:hypothetical protein
MAAPLTASVIDVFGSVVPLMSFPLVRSTVPMIGLVTWWRVS